MAAAVPLSIDVVSDVVCPWCFIGKRRLEAAIASVPDVPVAVRWRPFLLDPSIPPGGLDRQEYMRQKFGDRDLAASHDRLTEMGRAEGAPYRFDLIKRSPNTIDAHRVVRWASEAGHEDAMVERLFTDYFVNGRDVGNHEILADAAESVGLDRTTTLRRLSTPYDRAAVEAEIAAAQRIGVTGVPCFIIGNKYGVVGAQTADILAGAIRKAAEERAVAPA
ncbi:MAG: DsbA family oxidoreductase [Bauldia sp.]|nr:DsbA family oxidoreductase [Bauldia sp.]